MKKPGRFLLLFSTLLVLTTLATPAAAQNNYFSWKLGLSQMEADNIKGIGLYASETVTKNYTDDDVTVFSIAYGHRFPESPLPLRMEIELSFRGSLDYKADPIFTSAPGVGAINSDINSHTLFANLYLDLLPNSPIIPYVGAGAGFAYNVWDYDTSTWWDTETTTNLGWNVCGGVAMKLNRKLMLDISYRYIDFGEAEAEFLKIEDITTSEIQLGLRLNF